VQIKQNVTVNQCILYHGNVYYAYQIRQNKLHVYSEFVCGQSGAVNI